jgi:class 3 adenylate cyclase
MRALPAPSMRSVDDEYVDPGVTETTTILITDLVGSTQLESRVGPVVAEELRQEHFGLVREAISDASGREIKNTGDGLVATFPSAAAAVSCSTAIQQEFERRNRDAAERLRIKVGVSSGDVTAVDGDVFGVPVIEAARLCEKCIGGQILAKDLVAQLAGGRTLVQGDRSAAAEGSAGGAPGGRGGVGAGCLQPDPDARAPERAAGRPLCRASGGAGDTRPALGRGPRRLSALRAHRRRGRDRKDPARSAIRTSGACRRSHRPLRTLRRGPRSALPAVGRGTAASRRGDAPRDPRFPRRAPRWRSRAPRPGARRTDRLAAGAATERPGNRALSALWRSGRSACCRERPRRAAADPRRPAVGRPADAVPATPPAHSRPRCPRHGARDLSRIGPLSYPSPHGAAGISTARGAASASNWPG